MRQADRYRFPHAWTLYDGRPGSVTVALVSPAGLEISLLGAPRVRRGGQPVSFDTRKATALLAHLALAGRPRSRESLCELLWPEQDPEHARGALRRTLSAVRKSVGEEWIDATGDSVALDDDGGELDLDVRRFRALAADSDSPEQLAAAVELFRGELLEGFALRDSPEWDAWQVYEADGMRLSVECNERAAFTARERRAQDIADHPELASLLSRRW